MKIILKARANAVYKDISIESFPFIIGRSEKPFAEFMYASREMSQAVSLLSRSHAVISEENGKCFIHDLGSKNGTRLNDQQLGPKPVEMKPGDRLMIAESLDYALHIEHPQTIDECGSFSLTLIPEDFQTGLPAVEVSIFPFIIGRQEDNFTPFVEKFPEQLRTLSRKHAQLTCNDDQVYVEDFNSANGTFLSGERLRQGTRVLKNGDKLSFGTFFKYMVRIYPKDVEETVMLGQAGTDDVDRTVVISQESIAPEVQQVPPKVDQPGVPSISTPTPENLPVPPVSPPPVKEATPADQSASFATHAGEGQPPPSTEAKSVEDTSTGKTVYMSSATQFLKILTPDGKKAADEQAEGGGKGEDATKSDGKSKSRKLVFMREIANAIWGDSAGKKGKRFALMLIVLIAAVGAGWYLFNKTPEQQLNKLWNAKQYEAYAKLANAVLAKNPENESLRLKATDAMFLTILPEFTTRLKEADFAAAKETLIKVPALSENNPAGGKSIILLGWVVDMESYFHTKGEDPPLEIFKDEAKIQALLNVWEKDRASYRVLIDVMMGKYPPFEPTHSLVFHHLNVLKKKAVLFGPINLLKQTITERLNDRKIEQISVIIGDYERRYPEIKGLEKLRSDADNYKTLMDHVDKNDFVSAHNFLEQVDFTSPFIAQRAEQLKTTNLPPVDVARRYRESSEAWVAGNAEKAIVLLEPLSGDKWGEQANEKLKHYRQVMDAFAALTKAKGSAGYSAKLVDFRRILKPDEDRFYFKLIEDDYSTVRKGELKRARNFFTKAQKNWETYIKSGRITGFLRLETTLSSRFKNRAGYLKSSYKHSQAAAGIYGDLNQNIPSKWEGLHDAITEEVEVQRLRIEDLRGVLGQEVSTAKLKLLPPP